MSVKLDDHRFAVVWNDTTSYPTIKQVAKQLGLTYEAAKSKAKKIRRKLADGKDAPELIDRSARPDGSQPLPEMRNQFRPEMTREDLIETIRHLYNANPDTNLTRNIFRRETRISDSTWNRFFGTFLEFRREAGIELNRNQHAIEREIAKHAAADHYREFNDRFDYGNRYSKSAQGTRHKIIMGASDLHDIEVDPFFLRVFIEAVRMVQPDVVNLGGDIFDLPEFGRFTVDPREWDVVGRIKFVHEKILKPIREAAPNAQIDFVEGNHEYRLLRHLADATPALKAVLSDLLGLTVPKILGLDQFEVNYIAKADLAAFNKQDQHREVERSYVVYDDRVMVHHHAHARSWGLPGWNGHHHGWRVYHQKNALQGAYQWIQLGCGHRLRASYAEGEFWSMGFNICHYSTNSKAVLHEYVNVGDMACVGGAFFHREPEERIGRFSDE